MDNMHQPPGGDPQDNWPTQELGPTAGPASEAAQAGRQPWGQPAGQPWGQPAGQPWGQPAGPAGPAWGQPPGADGASGPQAQRDGGLHGRMLGGRPWRGRALWWTAGLALVALLAGGGALAATSSTSPSPAGPTGQAAVLNTMLNSPTSPGVGRVLGDAATASVASAAPCESRAAKLRAAGRPFAARVALWRCGHRLRRIRALGGMHGQFTFETKTGPHTIAYERGVIKSASGVDVVIQAKDGATWTWVLGSSTVIRQSGKKVAASTLSDGENVFVGGPVVSGAYDGRLIVIRPSSGGASPGPASGS